MIFASHSKVDVYILYFIYIYILANKYNVKAATNLSGTVSVVVRCYNVTTSTSYIYSLPFFGGLNSDLANLPNMCPRFCQFLQEQIL